jgi:hypothetical protein
MTVGKQPAAVGYCAGFRMPAGDGGASNPAAGGRNPPGEETAMGERVAVPRSLTYWDLKVVAVIREHYFSIMAQTLLVVENSFCIMCNFKECSAIIRQQSRGQADAPWTPLIRRE